MRRHTAAHTGFGSRAPDWLAFPGGADLMPMTHCPWDERAGSPLLREPGPQPRLRPLVEASEHLLQR